MYCRNCGKPMEEADKFCRECGASATGMLPADDSATVTLKSSVEQGVATDKTKSAIGQGVATAEIEQTVAQGVATVKAAAENEGVRRYLLLGLSAVSIILLFLKWISVPGLRLASNLMGSSTEFSLFQIIGFANAIKELTGDSDLAGGTYFLGILFLIIALIALICHGRFCYKLISKDRSATNTGNTAFLLSIVLSVFVPIVMFFFNNSIKDAATGLETWINTAVATTQIPFIIMAVDFIGVLFNLRFSENRNPSENTTAQDIKEEVVVEKQPFSFRIWWKSTNLYDIFNSKIKCSQCGHKYKKELSFCPHCGHKKPD